MTLDRIEANQYANLQLKANSLNPVTAQSFSEKVTLNYKSLSRIGDMDDILPGVIRVELKDYIEDKLNKGEKIAFLAQTRRHVKIVQDALEKLYPQSSTISLVPEKSYNMTAFSTFISKYWNEIEQYQTVNITDTIVQIILQRLDHLVYNAQKAAPNIAKHLYDWKNENQGHIAQNQRAYSNGIITKDEFFNALKESMLNYEITNNAIKQSLVSARNEENKTNDKIDKANFIVSTIHSAKGLEFENVVVVHKDHDETDEESKRMYYVAFTRAMYSEYILSFGTNKTSKLSNDYQIVLDRLN